MAATVVLLEKNGTGAGTTTDKTSGTVRFKNADNSTVDLANPLVKSAGTDYSYEKWLRLSVTGGSFSQITNAKAYTDGTNGFGTGVEMFWKAVGTYATPAEASGTTGYVDAFTYTSGAALDLVAGTVTGTGQFASHLVAFIRALPAVAGGLTPGETATVSWDEI